MYYLNTDQHIGGMVGIATGIVFLIIGIVLCSVKESNGSKAPNWRVGVGSLIIFVGILGLVTGILFAMTTDAEDDVPLKLVTPIPETTVPTITTLSVPSNLTLVTTTTFLFNKQHAICLGYENQEVVLVCLDKDDVYVSVRTGIFGELMDVAFDKSTYMLLTKDGRLWWGRIKTKRLSVPKMDDDSSEDFDETIERYERASTVAQNIHLPFGEEINSIVYDHATKSFICSGVSKPEIPFFVFNVASRRWDSNHHIIPIETTSVRFLTCGKTTLSLMDGDKFILVERDILHLKEKPFVYKVAHHLPPDLPTIVSRIHWDDHETILVVNDVIYHRSSYLAPYSIGLPSKANNLLSITRPVALGINKSILSRYNVMTGENVNDWYDDSFSDIVSIVNTGNESNTLYMVNQNNGALRVSW